MLYLYLQKIYYCGCLKGTAPSSSASQAVALLLCYRHHHSDILLLTPGDTITVALQFFNRTICNLFIGLSDWIRTSVPDFQGPQSNQANVQRVYSLTMRALLVSRIVSDQAYCMGLHSFRQRFPLVISQFPTSLSTTTQQGTESSLSKLGGNEWTRTTDLQQHPHTIIGPDHMSPILTLQPTELQPQ